MQLAESGMQSAMHIVAQALRIPVMVVLILLVIIVVVCVGSVIVEYVTERRRFKENTPHDVNAVYDAAYENVAQVIADTSLLGPQKDALEVVANNMGLPDDDLFAMAKAELSHVNERYQNSVKFTDLLTRISPMMGLMCTLIPLGPGIVAMGQGDVEELSNSLLLAFDGTVAGLLTAVVAMVVSTIRKRWYGQYTSAMEALMTSILEKAEEARKNGIKLPHDYQRADLAESHVRGFSSQGAGASPAASSTAAASARAVSQRM